MTQLFHHPVDPHSRFIRLVLSEMDIAIDLVEERVWERREAFLHLNPAGTLPVLQDNTGLVVPGAGAICEYLDEVYGDGPGEQSLMGRDIRTRVETRRLIDWFSVKFYAEVSEYLVTEKIFKRFQPVSAGDKSPDTGAIRAAKNNVRYHLRYIGYLARRRNWLAGDRLSYADFVAAAHLSIVDYLGDVPWEEDSAAREWYARLKCRPSFRPLLSEVIRGTPPSATYADLDF